ncbi:hypothetical protein C4K03_3793 [Pseudomonas synxantha]|uniref:Arc-like DNA binding domain-containing protein n=1 Tax=Pseudomonas synxantha TaxID=47883 RepID=A0A3G7UBE6_9PSED|nr:Arc family DNA-binding protein [Pseudomonas synxantha]AZE55946.1 hypothetical protein C4K03_3793 [Pseudomonas synxantha]
MPNNLEAFIVRLPSHLHAKIKTTAKMDRRSMNKEIVRRLERSFESSQGRAFDDSLPIHLLQKIELLEKKGEPDERVSTHSEE